MLELKLNNKQKGKYLDYVLKKDNFIAIYTLQPILEVFQKYNSRHICAKI